MKEENDMLQSYKDRIKRQNDAVKNNYDKISCTIPKGTKDKIRSHGYSVNTFVNEAIRRYLAYLEPAKPVEEKQQFVLKDGRIARTPEERKSTGILPRLKKNSKQIYSKRHPCGIT